MNHTIDTTFDFRTDAGGGDPDTYSPTLKSYHKLLWSKKLPNGKLFTLNDNVAGRYLTHSSSLGEFHLTSDSVIQTFTHWKRYKHITEKLLKEEIDYFHYIGYTIGGMMLFPGNRLNGKMTINGERGFNTKIVDRFDLTLECVRRHYNLESSPLSSVLDRYANFFQLFVNFKGYVEYFLLQDLVDVNFSGVKFFSQFDNFESSPLPSNLEQYKLFRDNSLSFIKSRNMRINLWIKERNEREQYIF